MKKVVMIVPLVALAVALAQLGLWQGTAYSPWKGGGFGMYTEPHPTGSRTVWLSAVESDGSETELRLYPADNAARKFYDQLTFREQDAYRAIGRRLRMFAILPNKHTERDILKKLSNATQNKIALESSELHVYEQAISVEASQWVSRKVYDN